MEASTLSSPLTESQQYMLRLMSNINEEDLLEIKKMIRHYLAKKLTMQADDAWQKNGWTQADETQLLNSHLRTTYSKNR